MQTEEQEVDEHQKEVVHLQEQELGKVGELLLVLVLLRLPHSRCCLQGCSRVEGLSGQSWELGKARRTSQQAEPQLEAVWGRSRAGAGLTRLLPESCLSMSMVVVGAGVQRGRPAPCGWAPGWCHRPAKPG